MILHCKTITLRKRREVAIPVHKGSEDRTHLKMCIHYMGEQDTWDGFFMKQLSESHREAQQRINPIFNAKFINAKKTIISL